MKKAVYLFLLIMSLLVIVSCQKTTESNQDQLALPAINSTQLMYDDFVSVTMSHELSGVQIRYTLDGTTPDLHSALYDGAFNIDHDVVVKAIAIKTGFRNSAVKSLDISVIIYQLPLVEFSISPNVFVETQMVGLTHSVNGVQIRYSLDGTEPSEQSPLYIDPITVSSTCTIKARAFKEGCQSSAVASGIYIIRPVNTGEMILVSGGSFNMGSSNGDSDESPVHSVELSAYYIGKYEVTQKEWVEVMGSNPSVFNDNENRPIENISWRNAIVFCNKKSMNEGFTVCYSVLGEDNPDNWANDFTTEEVVCNWEANGYRLATEAEWEFAARGGVYSHNYQYSGSNDINIVSWHSGNSSNSTHIVSTKIANELGIYDMTGNVWEWVWDHYGIYNAGAQTDPKGPESGTQRVLRGGSWNVNYEISHISYRDSFSLDFKNNSVGLRVVRNGN